MDGDCKDLIENLELMTNKLKDKVIKRKIKNYFFDKNNTKYIGFWVIRECVQTVNS